MQKNGNNGWFSKNRVLIFCKKTCLFSLFSRLFTVFFKKNTGFYTFEKSVFFPVWFLAVKPPRYNAVKLVKIQLGSSNRFLSWCILFVTFGRSSGKLPIICSSFVASGGFLFVFFPLHSALWHPRLPLHTKGRIKLYFSPMVFGSQKGARPSQSDFSRYRLTVRATAVFFYRPHPLFFLFALPFTFFLAFRSLPFSFIDSYFLSDDSYFGCPFVFVILLFGFFCSSGFMGGMRLSVFRKKSVCAVFCLWTKSAYFFALYGAESTLYILFAWLLWGRIGSVDPLSITALGFCGVFFFSRTVYIIKRKKPIAVGKPCRYRFCFFAGLLYL